MERGWEGRKGSGWKGGEREGREGEERAGESEGYGEVDKGRGKEDRS